jgi:hypothetical protein
MDGWLVGGGWVDGWLIGWLVGGRWVGEWLVEDGWVNDGGLVCC